MLKSESGETLDPEKAPLLFLDVNIAEGRSAKLVLFEGDDARDVVDTFAEVYKLTGPKKRKLLDIVNRQLLNVLNKIGENSSEDG